MKINNFEGLCIMFCLNIVRQGYISATVIKISKRKGNRLRNHVLIIISKQTSSKIQFLRVLHTISARKTNFRHIYDKSTSAPG